MSTTKISDLESPPTQQNTKERGEEEEEEGKRSIPSNATIKESRNRNRWQVLPGTTKFLLGFAEVAK